MPMEKTAMMLVLLIGWHVLHPGSAAEDTHSDQYTLCTRGRVAETGSNPLGGRSHLDCLQACSNTAGCAGVNVCPSAGGGSHERLPFACSLLTDALEYRTCEHLTAASSAECYYAFKNLVCQHGGVADVDEYKCQCPVEYAGRTCQRYIRDCTEALENRYQSLVSGNNYFIQPINSSCPFLVPCTSVTGSTRLLRRYSAHLHRDWDTCKAGFGNPTYPSEFFVGLDNLHHLTQQADYRLTFSIKYGSSKYGEAIYHNFTIGPESSSFALTYDSFTTSSMDNGFSTAQPVVFSATGHCGCCVNGSAGWYGSDCTGISVFDEGSNKFDWPVNGTLSEFSYAMYMLVRTSDYCDEGY